MYKILPTREAAAPNKGARVMNTGMMNSDHSRATLALANQTDSTSPSQSTVVLICSKNVSHIDAGNARNGRMLDSTMRNPEEKRNMESGIK